MGEFKDKMCACKDKKCADDVQDQMNKWSAESAKSAGDKPEKPDEKTMKEMQDVGTKYGECMAKAMGGGDMTTPPEVGLKEGSVPAWRLSENAGGYVDWADGGKTSANTRIRNTTATVRSRSDGADNFGCAR